MADDNTGTGTGQGGTDQNAWTPPTREEWEKAQAELTSTVDKLKSASAESAERKRKLAELAKQHETDAEKAQREAQEKAGSSLRPKLLLLTGSLATAFAEARPERLSALFKLVDFDKVDTDNLTGLDAEVTRLKAEFPEFFRGENDQQQQQTGGRPAGNGNAEVGNRAPGAQKLSPLEMLTAQMQGAAK